MVSGSSNWTIPNALTMARILFTPLFVGFFLDGSHRAALFMFFLAGATDALDGFLARVLNQRSPLGAVLDPVADKILLDSAYVCLAHAGWIPTWLAVAVVSRDVLILGGVALLTFWGQDMRASIKPSLTSKATTVFQMALALAAFWRGMAGLEGALGLAVDWLAWATAALTFVSGSLYVVSGLTMFKGASDQD
ncbi:MAG: CDP-alcohol phosphatidyltransferase family protein [Desulfovibrio sp.]|nr:CDP-alcohol phosphatidyltransferase family protein [Desulfovibrio sp.]MBI4959922.1 CDP-alcohol phosphatidyltransferase family protein [Desulfovibrio sp.]